MLGPFCTGSVHVHIFHLIGWILLLQIVHEYEKFSVRNPWSIDQDHLIVIISSLWIRPQYCSAGPDNSHLVRQGFQLFCVWGRRHLSQGQFPAIQVLTCIIMGEQLFSVSMAFSELLTVFYCQPLSFIGANCTECFFMFLGSFVINRD